MVSRSGAKQIVYVFSCNLDCIPDLLNRFTCLVEKWMLSLEKFCAMAIMIIVRLYDYFTFSNLGPVFLFVF